MQNVSNENLALTVGFSLLRSYLLTIYKKQSDYYACFKKGFSFPETKNNQSYRELLLLMLHYDVSEKHYSILALANILFMIEKYTEVVYMNETKQISNPSISEKHS